MARGGFVPNVQKIGPSQIACSRLVSKLEIGMICPLSFNVLNREGSLLCPVCGFPDFSNSPPYSKNGGEIGTAICPCCLWEPGFDDCPAASARAKETIIASVKAYRSGWAATKQWQGNRDRMPENFDSAGQLAKLLETAPILK